LKLRILRQSIRLRLTQPEVAELGQGKPVSAELIIGPAPHQQLIYSLMPSSNDERVTVSMDTNHIVITLPIELAGEFAETELVTIEESIASSPESSLTICIEKDFQCLKPRADGQDEGTFSDPNANPDESC
jgi:hypothetical protein